ncbi:MAG TPA: hypothetical protein PLN89_04850, partial [Elusimicrobiota bacterium]|nr:hypothetical protein [Elusimicrobiota bacterium]
MPKDFKHWLMARWLSNIAKQLLSVAVAWQVYVRTRDPLALGLVGLSPVALDGWRSWQSLLAAGGASALVGAALALQEVLVTFPMTALGMLRLVPPPLLIGYLLSTLLLATVSLVV